MAGDALRCTHLVERRARDDELAAVAHAQVEARPLPRAQAEVQPERRVEAALVKVELLQLLERAGGRPRDEVLQALAAAAAPHRQDGVAGELDHVAVMVVHDRDQLLEEGVEDRVERLGALLASFLALQTLGELREAAHV